MTVAIIEEPFGAKALTLESPDFSVQYPTIHRKTLIAPEWLALMDRVWRTERFKDRKIRIYRLHNVFVGFEGLVFDKYLNVYKASVTGHTGPEIERAADLIRAGLKKGTMPVHLGAAVLCTKRGATNYGHYLVEMLPKAFLVRACFPTDDLHYVAPQADGALGEVITQSFGMIGVDGARLIRSGLEPAFFKEVLVVDGLTQHGSYMSPVVLGCLDHLAAEAPTAGAERIYVSRKSAPYRKLRNEDELVPVFRRNGYAIVDPVAMSFRKQIAVFKGARSIVGINGAGMTNICFSPPGASVTCLTPGTMPETFYWFLCTHKRHRFRDVRFQAIGGEPPGYSPWDGDITIDADELETLLNS